MAGLPASYLKKHPGDMKAAWAAYHRDHPKHSHHKKPTHHRSGGENVLPTRDGTGIRVAGRALHANIAAHTPVEFDKEALGAMLEGFILEARKPRIVDTTEVFPPHEPSTEAFQAYKANAQEREIGREMYRILGYAMVHFRVTPAEFQTFAANAQRAVGSVAAMGGPGAILGGFVRPFDAPTRVTQPFGTVEPDGSYHRGIDLASDVGTPVHAPWPAKIVAVFSEPDAGGNVVRLGLQRPDGGYAGDGDDTLSDDSGLLLSFLHLSAIAPGLGVGSVVNPGDVVAYTGNTGRSTGPHLHIMAEVFADKPFYGWDSNQRVVVDPAALYGGVDALAAGAPPEPLQAGQVMQGVEFDRDAGALLMSASEKQVPVTITNNGALVIGGGTAVNVRAKAVLPLGEMLSGGGTGEGGFSNMPVPDELRGVAQQVTSRGGSVLQGIGNLAGQLFGSIASPDGIAQLFRLGASAAGAAGSLAGVAGRVAAAAAPFLTAIPVVGEFLGPAAAIVGPVLSVFGPLAGPISQAGNNVLFGQPPGGGFPSSSPGLGSVQDAFRGPAPQSQGAVLQGFAVKP